MITGTSYNIVGFGFGSGSPYYDEWEVVSTYKQKKTYFLCENCGNRYLIPEMKGTNLILLVCSSCGGRLREE